MVISETCDNFIVFKHKVLQTIIVILTRDKFTELFCMVDDLCVFFDSMIEKYALKSYNDRCYYRDRPNLHLLYLIYNVSCARKGMLAIFWGILEVC